MLPSSYSFPGFPGSVNISRKDFLPADNPGSSVFNFSNIHIAPFVILSKDFGNFLNFIFTENKTVSDRTADAIEKYINNQKNK